MMKVVKNALEDVRLFDGGVGSGDRRAYVMQVLKRGFKEAFIAPPALEGTIFEATATRAAYFLDESDGRRGSACARAQLEFAKRADSLRIRKAHLSKAFAMLNEDTCSLN